MTQSEKRKTELWLGGIWWNSFAGAQNVMHNTAQVEVSEWKKLGGKAHGHTSCELSWWHSFAHPSCERGFTLNTPSLFLSFHPQTFYFFTATC